MTTQVVQPFEQLFVGDDDITCMYAQDKEHYFLLYPRIRLYRRHHRPCDLNVYGQPKGNETQVDELFWDLPAYVQLEPPQQELDKFGLDDKQDGIVVFSVAVFADLETVPQIGDRFRFKDQSFELVTVKPDGYINNTDIFIHWVCTLKKNKTNSAIDTGLVGTP